MSRRIALAATACLAVASLAVQAAGASPRQHATPTKHHVVDRHHVARSSHLLLGINDEASTLYGNPAQAFQVLKTLRTQVLRVNLYWGGNKWAVANSKPLDGTDPGDPAYRWQLYDRLVRYAATYKIKVVFSIVYTPGWANGGKGKTVAPTSMQDLQDFAYAAAMRYSGYYVPPTWQQMPTLASATSPLPEVNLWTAWNEPNNPVFLTPQYARSGGKWVPQAAMTYAKICNTIYAGVHSAIISPQKGAPPGEQVACGVTDPRGNDNPGVARASIDPISFLTAAKAAGMGPFDAYAHNPYASAGNEPPNYVPRGRFARRIQLGNINVLLSLISKYYGPKHLWITEYGYQTNPPDKTIFGTSWKNQALWLKQAYTMARSNPRIDMFLWYLIRDEPIIGGWQSGLQTVSGKMKPSFNVFRTLPHS